MKQNENCSHDVHWLMYRTQGYSKANMTNEDGLQIVQYETNGGSAAFSAQIITRADSTVKGYLTSIYLQLNKLKNIYNYNFNSHTNKKLLETFMYNKIWYLG